MTIANIFEKKGISVRSYNVCKNNGLLTVTDLKDYYLKNRSFKNLNNCGGKSNKELIALCLSQEKNDKPEVINVEENSIKNIVNQLTRLQKRVINDFIEVNTNSLSVRSKNAIAVHIGNNFKIRRFAERVFCLDGFSVSNLKNVGSKSIAELDVYISLIEEFLLEIKDIENDQHLNSLKNRFLIQQSFSIPNIPQLILETNSIFLLVDFLLQKKLLFNDAQTVILKRTLKIIESVKESSLDEVADLTDLSRERVRQIRKFCLENLLDKLSFIRNFDDNIFQKYNLDINFEHIFIDSEKANLINKINDTNFTKEFITYILYSYLYESFSLIGNEEDSLHLSSYNSNNRYNWKNSYLAKKEIVSAFDFKSFADDIGERVKARIKESYHFNFISYVSRFISKDNYKLLYSISQIAEVILNNEFEIYIDLNENLHFQRNTKLQIFEYAKEALENIGKPSKVKVIFDKVIELHPNYNTTEAKIRVSMRRKDGFTPIGRTSVFGLKKWESKIDDFKGGTIREIVEEYLEKFDEPRHISDISEYVTRYRPKSNQTSILQNLRLDESCLYVFFKGSKIGLSTKTYQYIGAEKLKIDKPNIRTWEVSFDNLSEFINENNRLPHSSGVSKNEKRLYRWLNIQHRNCDIQLDTEKSKSILSIFNKFPQNHGKRGANLIENYQTLIEFLNTEKRLPSASIKKETKLYRFFYLQKNKHKDGLLTDTEKEKFSEIMKTIKLWN
jgi:hypothetical protein